MRKKYDHPMLRKYIFVLALLFLLTAIFLTVSSSTAEGQDTRIYLVAWSPDSTKIATGYGDGTIRIWDTVNDSLTSELSGHTDSVYSLAWAPDNTRLVSGSVDSSVRIWDTSNGQVLREIANAGHHIFAVAWIDDGTNIVSGSVEPDNGVTLQKWNAATGERLQGFNAGTVFRIVASTIDDTFITINPSGRVSRWDAQSLQRLSSFGIPRSTTDYTSDNNFNAGAISIDGSQIATGTVDGTIHLWDVTTGQITLTLDANDAQTVDWTVSAVQGLQFDSTATHLYAVSSNGTLRGWELATGQVISNIQLASPIYAAAWSPDGSSIAYGGAFGRDGHVTVYAFQPDPIGAPAS